VGKAGAYPDKCVAWPAILDKTKNYGKNALAYFATASVTLKSTLYP